MNIRLRKITAVVLTVFMLLCMTGCEELDYREAVQLYNARKYTEAAALFDQLGQYEDSAELRIRCDYWVAVDTMSAGDYTSALTQFQALNGFEDSDARVAECKYQLAMAAFEAGDLPGAEKYFLDIPDYKQAPECLRQINWQKFYDAVMETGTAGEVESALTLEQDGRVFQVIARNADKQELIFSVSAVKDMGYVFTDTLILRFTREAVRADFSAESTFSMDFNSSQIGSRQTGGGSLDIATCTAQTPLVLDSFGITVTDNLGKSTTSTDPKDCLMADAMADNFSRLIQILPQFVADNELPVTLAQIGFSAIS